MERTSIASPLGDESSNKYYYNSWVSIYVCLIEILVHNTRSTIHLHLSSCPNICFLVYDPNITLY